MLLLLSSIWIKNEAMFFSFICIFLILCLPKKSSLFKLSIFFSFFLIIILRFLIFEKIGLDTSIASAQGGMDIEVIRNLLLAGLDIYFMFDRISLIIKYLFFGLLSNLIYVISIFAMLFMFFYRKKNTDLSFYFVSLMLNFLLISSFYIFITNAPIEWALKVTIERVVFEVLGIYIIPIVIFINVYSKKIFKI